MVRVKSRGFRINSKEGKRNKMPPEPVELAPGRGAVAQGLGLGLAVSRVRGSNKDEIRVRSKYRAFE